MLRNDLRLTVLAAVILFVAALVGCGGGVTSYIPDSPPPADNLDNGPLRLKMLGRVGQIIDGVLTYNMRIGEAGVLSASLDVGSPHGSPWWKGTDPNVQAGATLMQGSLTSLRGQVAIAERQGECVVTVGWDNLQSSIKIIVDGTCPTPGHASNVMGQTLTVDPALPVENGFATLHLAPGASRKMAARQVSGSWWQGKIVWEVPEQGSFTATPYIGQSSTIGRTNLSGQDGYLIVSDDQLAVPIKLVADE